MMVAHNSRGDRSESWGPSELDEVTLARCRRGDPMAFRAFVVRYQRPVFALLSRLVGHGQHVEDLAQETFLRAFRALPRFDVEGAARPSTWLLTIATRLALDARKRKVLPQVSLDVFAGAANGTPERGAQQAELGRAIARAAEQLSDEQRAVFVLTEFHGLSQAEIAAVIEVPAATVKTRLFRARARLRELLAPLREEM